jgi:hypothetical protein
MKKKLKIIVLLFSILLSIVVMPKDSNDVSISEPTIIERSIDEEINEAAMCKLDPINMGGGGLINSDGALSGAGAGGDILTPLIYWVSTFIQQYVVTKTAIELTNTQTNTNNNTYNDTYKNPTEDDLFNNEGIKDLMKKHGWTKEEVKEWIFNMTGVSIATFLNNNSNNIRIYIGSTQYEISYSGYRDISNNMFTFFIEDDGWDTLVRNVCQENYDKVWALNYIWIIMGIIKNATFVLVTPSIGYIDYSTGTPLNHGMKYIPMYSKELATIYSFGYRWNNQTIPMEEARRGQ